jgi:hypothetical protein
VAEAGVSVLVIHNTGKDAERGARGSQSLFDLPDCVVEVEQLNGNDTRAWNVQKVREGNAGDRFGYQLEMVDLGNVEDIDGSPKTVFSATIVPVS